jgi:hypothetical protein
MTMVTPIWLMCTGGDLLLDRMSRLIPRGD